MRPTILLACFWACSAHSLATAQSPQTRPSALRDAGVINRAAPPDFSTAPNYPPTSPAPAFSDQAWTGAPTQPSATARLSDAPSLPPVMPAQYTSSDQPLAPVQSAGPVAQMRPASYQATGNAPVSSSPPGGATHEPRPLKPPTVSEAKANSKGSTGTVQMFVSVMSSLAIVIGLILAAAWFYRKAAPSISGALPKQVVQVLGRTPLAPRQQLVLLRLGSKLVLVSNLHGEVRTISEITDPLEVDRLAGLCEASQPGSISESFRSVLHNIGRNG